MTNNQKGFAQVLLIILVFLTGIGGVAYFAFKNGQIKINPKSNSPITASPTQVITTPVPDVPSNWETYSSPDNDYSFKHPSGIKSDTGAGGVGFESIRFVFMGQKQIDSGRTQTELADGYSFSVIKLGSVNKYDPSTEAQKSNNNDKESCANIDPEISSVIKTTVSGHDAYQYEKNCMGNSTITYISNGVNVYLISQFYAGDKEDLPVYRTTTLQIYSSFKFNLALTKSDNSVNYSSGKDWHKVNNSTLGLSFCLPPKWDFSKNGDGSFSGNLIFYRDAGYTPTVSYISDIPYSEGSRREAYYKYWESEYPKVRESVSIQEILINNDTVLKINTKVTDETKTSPDGSLAVVWYAKGKLWKAGLSGWSSVNDSQTLFLKDFYTVISCTF